MGLQEFVKEKLRLRNDSSLEEDFPAAIEEQSRFLESVLEAIEAGVVVVDRQGRSLLFNQRGAEIAGLGTPGSKQGGRRHTYDVLRPDEKTPFPLKDMPGTLALRGERSDAIELFIRSPQRPEGLHVTATAEPLRDPDGNVKGAVTVFKDITRRKRAEEFLRRQAGILEATSDFVGFAAPDGTIQYVNYAGREMCGLGKGFDVTTMKISDLHPKWVNRLLTEQAFPIADRIGIWKGEAAFQHIDGHEIPVSMVLLAQRSEDGLVRYYSTISRDITELKWAEKKQQESKARRHDFFEANPLAIMEGDLSQVHVAFEELRAEGITDLREHLKTHPEFLRELVSGVELLDANQAAVRLTGAGHRDELLVGLHGLFVPETMKAFGDIMVTLWEGGAHYEGESLFSTFQGVPTHILLTLTVTENPSDVKRVIVTLTDITELRRTEDKLARKAQELARSNKDLEQFAHVASHDLKEPLRTITSYLQLLEERYRKKLDKDADTFIAFALDGAKRMQRQITDLLEYSRVGGTSHDRQPVNCETVLHQAIADLEGAIQETGAEITHGDLPEVLGNQTQLMQLFQNLIGNAVKFHGPDSPKVHISVEEADGEWRFAVQDNGLGIDPEYTERIFTIFQRLHTREAYPGTGIGLAICRKIVEGFGGRIWVDSEAGKGSTFYFTLPGGVRNDT